MKTDGLFQKYYFSRPGFVNGTVQAHELCRSYIPAGSRILEIGAGPNNATSDFLATIGPVSGLDVSREVYDNTSLASAHVFDGRRFPFEPERFDACVSNYVLEHVEDTALHFAEVARVLRPGGVYCFRTPNHWHYVGMISSVLPHGVHLALANRLRSIPEAHDPYPTFYRANSLRRVAKLCETAGLETEVLRGIEVEPSYGRISPLLFFPMLAYERLVNASSLLEGLRVNILGVMRKPGAVLQKEGRVPAQSAAKR
jgi:SAM-dependent methyltransferase